MVSQRVGLNGVTKPRATESYQKTLSNEISAETFWQKIRVWKTNAVYSASKFHCSPSSCVGQWEMYYQWFISVQLLSHV